MEPVLWNWYCGTGTVEPVLWNWYCGTCTVEPVLFLMFHDLQALNLMS